MGQQCWAALRQGTKSINQSGWAGQLKHLFAFQCKMHVKRWIKTVIFVFLSLLLWKAHKWQNISAGKQKSHLSENTSKQLLWKAHAGIKLSVAIKVGWNTTIITCTWADQPPMENCSRKHILITSTEQCYYSAHSALFYFYYCFFFPPRRVAIFSTNQKALLLPKLDF